MNCRHCHARKGCEARRLCRRCYDNLNIRKRYSAKPWRQGAIIKDFNGDGEVDTRTTKKYPDDHPMRKVAVAVMTDRVAKRMQIFHPGDRDADREAA